MLSNIEINYIGLDIEQGPNVDVVMDELYSWNSLQNEEFDYIISGQAFEHIEYPWLTMKEIYKKLKPDGIICIIAPNGLFEHRYPVDCYRYYADGMRAIAESAGLKVIEVSVAGIPHEGVSLAWDDILSFSTLFDVDFVKLNEEDFCRYLMVCPPYSEVKASRKRLKALTSEYGGHEK
nr:methyltransferase domain-containing protein [uncultured Schaedlerella sp.]